MLANEGPFVPLLIERQRGETQLFAKEVKVEGKRYIVCRNETEAEKDRKDREAIVTALDAQLKRGDKALVRNSAYRRYLRKTTDGPAFAIDAGKLAEEARFDGVFVLRTNAKITPLQAVLRYRDLLQVENLFLRTKAVSGRGRSSIPPTPRYGATYFVFPRARHAEGLEDLSRQAGMCRNGRRFCAVSIACNMCASATGTTIGWSAPTPRSRSPICSATPTSRCRHALSKSPHRNSRRPRNRPKTPRRPSCHVGVNSLKAA